MDGVNLEAVAAAVTAGQASGEEVGVSWLQRRYRLGFRSATALKQQLEGMGIVFVPIVWKDDDSINLDTSDLRSQP